MRLPESPHPVLGGRTDLLAEIPHRRIANLRWAAAPFVTKRSLMPSFSCSQPTLGPHHQEEPVSSPHLLTPEEKLAAAKKLLSLPRIVVICGSTCDLRRLMASILRR